MIINVSASSVIMFPGDTTVVTQIVIGSYGSIQQADRYFANKLSAEMWFESDARRKQAALAEATELINNLKYSGTKTVATQLYEFPRNSETIVPRDIEIACYEIALKLLQDIDIDIEIQNFNSTLQTYGGARTTYTREFLPDHLLAGIPSFKAWGLLKPYLDDPNTITLSRVN